QAIQRLTGNDLRGLSCLAGRWSSWSSRSSPRCWDLAGLRRLPLASPRSCSSSSWFSSSSPPSWARRGAEFRNLTAGIAGRPGYLRAALRLAQQSERQLEAREHAAEAAGGFLHRLRHRVIELALGVSVGGLDQVLDDLLVARIEDGGIDYKGGN